MMAQKAMLNIALTNEAAANDSVAYRPTMMLSAKPKMMPPNWLTTMGKPSSANSL